MTIPDDFDPKPTIPTGGLERMIQIWEASRDTNSGGYGGGVLQHISDWGKPSLKHTTSCSPFTATCIGMMFDPSGATDDATVYAPVINNGTSTLALPVDYYMLHNGFYFQADPDVPAAIIAARSRISTTTAGRDATTPRSRPCFSTSATRSTSAMSVEAI
jgi:hypothetical protein